MATFAAVVDSIRPFNSSGKAVGFFNFHVGMKGDDNQFTPLFTVKDCTLNRSNSDDGFWVAFPSKPRMRGGVQQQNDEGKNIYDDLVIPFMAEDENGKFGPTKAGYKFKDYIASLASAKYAEGNGDAAGRGAPRAAATERGAPPAPGKRNAAPAAAAAPANRARAAAAPKLDADDGYAEGDADSDTGLPF